MIHLDTEHGPAQVWWDGDSDPESPGWVLRYHLAPAHPAEDALGRRNLDEILPLDADADSAQARSAALEFLGRHSVGAGDRLTSSQAAALAGLASGASWRATSWRPDPAGHHEGRVAWWWESAILAAMATRPGRGYRSDLDGRL